MMGTIVDETALIAALREGDEAVFAQLVDQHTPSMLRVARGYVPSREIAEEVVQDTWIALVKGISNFEGRSPGAACASWRHAPTSGLHYLN